MAFTQEEKQQSELVSTSSAKLEELINNAIKKVGVKKENDLCHFLPAESGGYLHHFTLRKMKQQVPEQLFEMINKYIINTPAPMSVPPKRRAARGSRKRKDQIVLTKSDIDRILHMARTVGDKEVVSKLTPKKDLRTIKRELISSVRHNQVEQDLWESYIETVSVQSMI